MSDPPSPPPLPVDDRRESLAEVLHYRTMFFVTAFIGIALVYLPATLVFNHPLGARPEALTWGMLAGTIFEIPFFPRFFFVPSRLVPSMIRAAARRRKPLTIRSAGVTICATASALVSVPALFGYTLWAMSGQAWRAIVFLPVSAATAVALWRPVGRTLEALAASGVR